MENLVYVILISNNAEMLSKYTTVNTAFLCKSESNFTYFM